MSASTQPAPPSVDRIEPLIGDHGRAIDDAAVEEAVEHLRALLRIDTTNLPDAGPPDAPPPGNETEACRYLEKVLQAAGLEPAIHESAPGRGNLIVRLPATDPDPSCKPLLLTSHLDVVPADPARWTHPPFGGEVHGGYIWGRGAIDMKGMTAMSLLTLLTLKRRGVKTRRDVIMSAVADEEAGGRWGMGWLVDHHAEELRAEYALNELGGFTFWVAGQRVYPIQVAEKGVAWMRLRARANPGHGSVPRRRSAVGTIAQAVARLHEQQPPLRICAPQAAFIEALAATLPTPAGVVYRLASKPLLAERVLPRLDPARAEVLLANMRNTANPTVLKAGNKVNVLPGEAEALVDGRVLPGSSTAELIEQVRAILGPLADDIAIEVTVDIPPTHTSADTDMFRTIAQTVARHDPGATAVPNLIPGYTDACWLSRIGVKTYGFSPVWLGPDVPFASLYHGDDERVPLDGFAWGLRALFDVVLATVGVR